MKQHGIKFHEGIPDSELLPVWFPKGGLLVLDDLMEEGGNDKRVLDLFTKHSHHQNVTVLYLVSRHVSTREICQEHFQERALHCGFQEPPRSIGDAESVTASVSRAMARGARHLSKSHRTPFWLHAIGSPPQEQ